MSNESDTAWMYHVAANSLEMADMALARRDVRTALAQVEVAQQMLLSLKLTEEHQAIRMEMALNDLRELRRLGF